MKIGRVFYELSCLTLKQKRTRQGNRPGAWLQLHSQVGTVAWAGPLNWDRYQREILELRRQSRAII